MQPAAQAKTTARSWTQKGLTWRSTKRIFVNVSNMQPRLRVLLSRLQSAHWQGQFLEPCWLLRLVVATAGTSMRQSVPWRVLRVVLSLGKGTSDQ